MRRNAADALGSIGTEAKAAVPDLVNALKNDKDAFVRSSAASALGRLGTEAKAAVPDLVNSLKDKDGDVRSRAAGALGNIGTEAKAAVPDLVNALKNDERASVRGSAADALGSIGTEAKAAVPDLVNSLKDDENASVRGSAAYALRRIALRLQENANTLSPKELDKAISGLEAALNILEEPKAEFSTDNITFMGLSLNALKAQRNANLMYWIQQNSLPAGIFSPSSSCAACGS